MLINTKELNEIGWTEIGCSLNDEQLISISNQIGSIVPHSNGNKIDLLIPKNKEIAIENTFSYKYEFNEFPMHTDTAFWYTPARYVILSCFESSETATSIINLNELLEQLNNPSC